MNVSQDVHGFETCLHGNAKCFSIENGNQTTAVRKWYVSNALKFNQNMCFY